MAKPHRKSLIGKEGGKKKAHWYDWLAPKRRIKKHTSSTTSGGQTKPGTWWVVYNGQS